MPLNNIAGKRYGRLTVISRVGTEKSGQAIWLCRCNCGTDKITNGSNLRTGHVRSCGCLLDEVRRAKFRKHGMSRGKSRAGEKRQAHPLYEIWLGIRRRCLSPHNHAYASYGGRGICMCPAWQNDFMAFVRDVGDRPSPQHSLDRINNDGHYEPGNVRWATAKEQADNRGHMTEFVQEIERLKQENTALVAEVERLRATLEGLPQAILKLPTWVEYNSYAAQLDMRQRAAEVVKQAANAPLGGGKEQL